MSLSQEDGELFTGELSDLDDIETEESLLVRDL